MFDKNDKRRLYWLIDEYLFDKIDESTFCDEYYYSYNLELDHATLLDNEKKLFSDLGAVASRFSEFEEDHKINDKAFSSASELRNKIIETKSKLEHRS